MKTNDWVLLVDAPRGANLPHTTYGEHDELIAFANELSNLECVSQIAVVRRDDLDAIR